ncbi:MAG: hypothetical protein IPM06_22060 [Rhizobiales bacterium]|nr:hypothetical protein [Hyphomicrobiales bacterium]
MSSVGQGVGMVVGGIIGAMAGGNVALGASIGGAIGGYIDPPKGQDIVGPRLSDLSVQTNSYGAVVPRVYGTVALNGNLIWLENNQIKEVESKEIQGGKGGGGAEVTTYSYFATFAVAFCEGPVDSVLRIWAGSTLIYSSVSSDYGTIISSQESSLYFSVYYGTDDQQANPRMQAALGIDSTPAFRGLCYLVFEDFPLKDYGNSLLGCPIRVELTTSVTNSYQMTVLNESRNALGGAVKIASWIDDDFNGLTLYRQGNQNGFIWYIETIDPFGAYLGTQITDTTALGLDYYLNGYGCHQTDVPVFCQQYLGPVWETYVITWSGNLISTVSTGEIPSTCGLIHRADGDIIYVVSDPAQIKLTGVISRTINLSEMVGRICSVAYTGDLMFAVSDENLTGDSIGLSLFVIDMTTGSYYIIKHDGTTNFEIESFYPKIHGYDGVCYLQNRGDFYRYTPGDSALVVIATNMLHPVIGEIPMYFKANHSFSMLFNPTSATGAETYTSLAMFSGSQSGGTKTLRGIVEAECVKSELITLDDIDATSLNDIVRGYRISTVSPIRGGFDQLQAAFPFDIVQSGYKIKFVRRGGSSVATITADDLGASDGGSAVRLIQSREMDLQIPARVLVAYLEQPREYEIGEQYAERLNTDSVNERRIDLSVVMTPDEAAQTAEKLLYLYWLERREFSFTLPPSFAQLEPADIVTVSDASTTYTMRLVSINLLPDGRVECLAKLHDSQVYVSAAVGQGGLSTGVTTIPYASPTEWAVLDVPCMDSTVQNSSGLVAAMGGRIDSWTGSVLFRSTDSGASWVDVAVQSHPGACIGYAESVLAAGRTDIIDATSTVSFLPRTYIKPSSVTETQLMNGANHFAIGSSGRWEIVAARTVTTSGTNGALILSDLMRGRFGTEQYTGVHEIGDAVVLLDPAAIDFVPMDTTRIGLAYDYQCVTRGAGLSSVSYPLAYSAINLKPLSPIRLSGSRSPSSFDWSFSWVRRSRNAVEPFSGVATPLGESSESYEVEVWDSSYATIKRTISGLTSATATYTSAQQVVDFGSNQETLYLRVYQLSSVVGRGYPLQSSLAMILSNDAFGLSVVLAMHMDGTNGSTTFTDLRGHVATANGNAQITTSSPKYGTGSATFDGSGDYVVIPDATDLELGSDNLTIEFWIKTTQTLSYACPLGRDDGSFPSGAWAILLNGNGSGSIQMWNASYSTGSALLTSTSAAAVNDGNWHHIAITRNGAAWNIWVDGSSVASNTWSGAVVNLNLDLNIGRDPGYSRDFAGQIDDLRITKSCRYTATFTPPTTAFDDP